MRRLDQWAPILGGLSVYVVYRLFYIEADIYHIDVVFAVKDLWVDPETTLGTLHPVLGRLNWSLTGIFFVLMFFSAIIVLGKIIYTQLGLIEKATNRYSIIVLSVVVVATAGGLSAGDNAFTVASFNPILEKTFELFEMYKAGSLMYVFTPMVLAVTILLMVAASSTLMNHPATGRSTESYLRDQVRHLNTLLFVGAAMLVAGIVHASAVHRLPATLLDENGADTLDQLVNGLSASMGTVWTMMLLGIYLPSVWVLRSRARRLALNAVAEPTPKNVDDWISKHGLSTQLSQKLMHVAALLSPMIIGGPAAPFLQSLTD